MDAKILNTAVENTTNGDGLSYYGTVADPVDFCSVDENNILFPLAFQALGKASTRVDCAKVGLESSLFVIELTLFYTSTPVKKVQAILCAIKSLSF